MNLAPVIGGVTVLTGLFEFSRTYKNRDLIHDSYKLKITISEKYPKVVPVFEELEGKIPRNPDYHVNPDGTFCLGSELRLLKQLADTPDLSSFVDSSLIPYLYAQSHKRMFGSDFVFGELQHGELGIFEDCENLFRLNGKHAVVSALELLGKRRRVANKCICPCGCQRNLSQCCTHNRLNGFRLIMPRTRYKELALSLKYKLNI
ncbi:hypothetical protein MTYP_00433 [Methylophilaceae bacterium]|nr:hypothetical protein MTYP_00433 [Methylophilaceae bacterium]